DGLPRSPRPPGPDHRRTQPAVRRCRRSTAPDDGRSWRRGPATTRPVRIPTRRKSDRDPRPVTPPLRAPIRSLSAPSQRTYVRVCHDTMTHFKHLDAVWRYFTDTMIYSLTGIYDLLTCPRGSGVQRSR